LELQHKHDLDSLDRLSLAFSCYLSSRLDYICFLYELVD
jgi:hypothetical protein